MYKKSVAQSYASTHGWFTPAELFSPFYGRAIARSILRRHNISKPLNIIEVGGGRGRLARDILDFLHTSRPDVFETCRYTIVEIAPNLVDIQRKVIHPWIMSRHASIISSDVLQWLRSLANEPCSPLHNQSRINADDFTHIIACEVLDNFPHDLIRIRGNEIAQAYVETTAKPLSRSHIVWKDDVETAAYEAMEAFNLHVRSGTWLDGIRSALDYALTGGTLDCWIPTDALALLRAIVATFPNHSITMADFSSFSGGLPGRNAPVVQRVDRGRVIVYDSVTDAPFGYCDILFPTNFGELKYAYQNCLSSIPAISACSLMSTKEFYLENTTEEDLQQSTCGDGWNPIISEFQNTSVLVSSCSRKQL